MLTLKDSCGTCAHFDGDAFCSLPSKDRLLSGHIGDPDRVVCAKHERRESDEQLEMLEAADKAHAADQIAYENSLTGHGRY